MVEQEWNMALWGYFSIQSYLKIKRKQTYGIKILLSNIKYALNCHQPDFHCDLT